MGLFSLFKKNKFVEQMRAMSTTNVALLNAMHEMQQEYAELEAAHEKVKAELSKIKNR